MTLRLFLTGILVLYFQVVEAQKVAVVLSGGGAKGIAHVGVLKALEEHNIPIDYIVGTSMGGLVGGFYAAGYSPDQIEQIVLSKAFQNWVDGTISDNYSYYFSKQDPDASWFSLDLALDSAFQTKINTNFGSDLALNFALSEYLAQPSQKSGYNFDSLFIPFRAVAADVFTQQTIALDHGDLNNALRATMAVPFIYRPVKIDGQYLFDGGIYNNFPVSVAQEEFDPDIIIGVNVSTKKFNEYPAALDEQLISNGLLYLLLDKADASVLDDDHIYLEPNLQRFSSMDFIAANQILDSGYHIAIRHMEEIQQKIERRTACEVIHQNREEFNLDVQPLQFHQIKIVGFKPAQERYIRSLFGERNGPVNIHDIRQGYYRLLSEDYFRNIYPNIHYNDSTEQFDFELYGKPGRAFKIKGGGNLATRSISNLFVGLQFSHFNQYLTHYNADFYTGRFYQSASLRTRISIPGRQHFYIQPELTYNSWDFINSNELIWQDARPTILEQIDRRAGVTLGMPLGPKNKLLGHAYYLSNRDRFSNLQNFNARDVMDLMQFRGFRYGLEFSRNRLNRRQYASEGSAYQLTLDYFTGREFYMPGNTSDLSSVGGALHEWTRFTAQAEKYFRLGRRYKYGFYGSAVFSTQPLFSNYQSTLNYAPAFYPLSDSRTLFLTNFRAFHYSAAGFRNVFHLTKNTDLRAEAYAFAPFSQIGKTNLHQPKLAMGMDKVHFAGQTALVYHTPLGPISGSVNYYDDPVHQWGFLLHIGYLIFHKRSHE